MSRILPTLQKSRAPMATGAAQREILRGVPLERTFERSLDDAGLFPLRPTGIEVLQLNVGKKCNQTCRHCHVDAGPDRTEMMPEEVVERCLEIIEATRVPTVDITGGAPELHPRWREIVARARTAGSRVLDRCNLTITLLPNYRWIPEFCADHEVEVVASLPHYRPKQTDVQRGDGVFAESIEALRRFNALGYGRSDGRLLLTLVTNPVGTFLPGDQAGLEREWKRQLERLYDIHFDRLYTITNMPISRFLAFLEESGRTTDYLETLAAAFNPLAAREMMCRTTLSVGWDGTLYDCDFNQMLDVPVSGGAPQTVFDFEVERLSMREIELGPHCYGCAAGAGSSCGGTVA